MSNLQCPVDFVTINENKARVNAFFVLGLAITFLLTGVWVIFVLLAVDFLLRTTDLARYSPIGFLSDAVIRQLKIKNKPVDRGPKRFAAGMGFVFTISILILLTLQQSLAVQVLTALLIICAFLEAVAGLCVGCYVYTLSLLLTKKTSK
jgi:hypothetical protein